MRILAAGSVRCQVLYYFLSFFRWTVCASLFLAHGEVVIDSSFYTLRINHHLPSACKSLFWRVLDSLGGLDGISAPRTLAYVAQRTSACVAPRTWTYAGLRTSAYVVQRMLAYVELRFFNESHALSTLFAVFRCYRRCTPLYGVNGVVLRRSYLPTTPYNVASVVQRRYVFGLAPCKINPIFGVVNEKNVPTLPYEVQILHF